MILQGKHILVTRAERQAETFAEKLRAHKAIPLIISSIHIQPPETIAPLQKAIQRLEDYDWIVFTSANGVRFFMERLNAAGQEALRSIKVAAVGAATACRLKAFGMISVHWPKTFSSDEIPLALGDVKGQRFLIPQADCARRTLTEQLKQRGALVDALVAYRTRFASITPERRSQLETTPMDVVTFTSGSCAQGVARWFEGKRPKTLTQAQVVCIGPVTANVAQEQGFHVDMVAQNHTTNGLIERLLEAKER